MSELVVSSTQVSPTTLRAGVFYDLLSQRCRSAPLLHRREDRLCVNFPASSRLDSLAAKLDPASPHCCLSKPARGGSFCSQRFPHIYLVQLNADIP